jgi:hypothetical protein
LELVELLWASCVIHSSGILDPELCVVLLWEDVQDLDWVSDIAVVCGGSQSLSRSMSACRRNHG